MKFNINKKYFADGALIVFSVLFALFINKIAENFQTNNKKEIAQENIKYELNENSKILKEWMELHNDVEKKIKEILDGENDSLKNKLLQYKYFNLGLLTEGKSLANSNLTNTAWETAKTTGIISEFDFEITRKLTEIYSLQNIITEKTFNNIIDNIFSANLKDPQSLDQILISLHLQFRELTGQEYLLNELVEKIDPHI